MGGGLREGGFLRFFWSSMGLEENPGFFLSFIFIYIFTYFFLWNMDLEDEIPGVFYVFHLYSYASFYEHELGGRDSGFLFSFLFIYIHGFTGRDSAVFYCFGGGDSVLER